ncbi:MAG: hypothetical protein WCI18_02545 [Pseudomonadota bacterium]
MGYLLVFFLMFWACGKDKSKWDASGGNEDPPGPTDSGLTSVSGLIQVNGSPTENLTVSSLDLTTGSRLSATTSKLGTWQFKTSQFSVGHEYSFQILSADQVLLAIMDFSDVSGLQGAISYNGGFGMDVGILDLPVDNFGLVDLARLRATPPRAAISGGFSVVVGKSGTIDEVTLPSFLDGSKSSFGHSLNCSLESDILNGFYLKSTNPALYQQVLNKCSGFFLHYTPATDKTLKQLWAAIPSPWMQLARKKKDMFSSETSADPWDATKRFLLAESGVISGDFTLPKLPCFGCVMDFYISESSSSTPQLISQGVAARLAMIPKPLAADKGSTSYSISYSNSILDNGLNRPFALASNSNPVVLSLSRPLLESQVPPVDSRWIYIKPTYYLSGVEITPSASDYSSPYNEDYKNGSYQWVASTRLLTLEITDGTNPDSVSIPDEIFLRGSSKSDFVKLKIIYETKTSKSGTIVNFKK